MQLCEQLSWKESERCWYWGDGNIIRREVRVYLKAYGIKKGLLFNTENRNSAQDEALYKNVNESEARVCNYWYWEVKYAVMNRDCLKKDFLDWFE